MFYKGRFAPSPTGPLHAGSLLAALASWLDARAHGGEWLVRMEDVDTPRCITGVDQTILQQLARCGLTPDAPPVWQSQRSQHYERAVQQLVQQHQAYPCACSRKDIAQAWAAQGADRPRHAELVYPGTCRHGTQGRSARAWRFHTGLKYEPNRPLALTDIAQAATKTIVNQPEQVKAEVHWTDRRLGPQQQDVERSVGDFVLRRADGLWAYQLAVVVDDAAQGISHVVRGEDLTDNTARQILLQRALGLPALQYLHTPLVLGEDGDKLSKQNGAVAFGDAGGDNGPLDALNQAARGLGLPAHDGPVAEARASWVQAWRAVYGAAASKSAV
ncbi:MAG: tRNA glutamyl-Q(34) synthetase GluQRS [Rhodoferax sp.]|nr:tRNA glutamyl-Q(34) synthetase GluQRS [Rhodoferax sp.]